MLIFLLVVFILVSCLRLTYVIKAFLKYRTRLIESGVIGGRDVYL